MSKICIIGSNCDNYNLIFLGMISKFYSMYKNNKIDIEYFTKQYMKDFINDNTCSDRPEYLNDLKEYIKNNDRFIEPYSRKIEFLQYLNGDTNKDNSLVYVLQWLYVLMHNKISLPNTILLCGNFYNESEDFSKIIKSYNSDSLMYYITRSVPLGRNFYFNERALIDTNNHILINFENFANRCYNMCLKVYPDNPIVPPCNSNDLENPIDVDLFISDINNHFVNFEIREAILSLERVVIDSDSHIDYVITSCSHTNYEKYVNKYLNLVYMFSHYYSLICPNLAKYIVNEILLMEFTSFDKLNLSILPHNKKLSKVDKISFVTIFQ